MVRIRPDNGQNRQPDQANGRQRRSLGIAGLTGGTGVMTDSGWTPVEEIAEGDWVMTFHDGPTQVTSSRSRTFGANLRKFWPNGLVYVPDGALGPAEAYYLLPGQQVMLHTDMSAALFDDPESLVPAAALEGINGITRVMPIDLIEVVELRFADDAMIECQGGTWARCPGVSARVKSAPLRRRRVFSHAGAA